MEKKKTPTAKKGLNQQNAVTADQLNVQYKALNNPTLGELLESKKLMEKRFFSVKKTHCFECETKLSKKNRKRMLNVWRTPQHVIFSPYQLCKPCAKKLDKNQFNLLPKIAKDLKAAAFQFAGADALCVGGMQ